MNKREFIEKLRQLLSGLPEADAEERLSFYGEMIDDRVEEGLSEEEAVKEIGSAESVADQILADTPLKAIIKEGIKPRRPRGVGTTLLIVLGFPVWLPLLAALFAVLLSLYAALWALVVSLWAVELSLAASAVYGLAAGAVAFFSGDFGNAVMMVGMALVCAGLSIVFFYGC